MGFFLESLIHSEGGLKASGLRQWLGTLVLELDHTLSYSAHSPPPRRLSHRDSINRLFCPLASSGIQPMVGSSQRKAPRQKERGWIFIIPAPFLQSLWTWPHLSPKICRPCRQSSPQSSESKNCSFPHLLNPRGGNGS